MKNVKQAVLVLVASLFLATVFLKLWKNYQAKKAMEEWNEFFLYDNSPEATGDYGGYERSWDEAIRRGRPNDEEWWNV